MINRKNHFKFIPLLSFIILFGLIFLLGRNIPDEKLRELISNFGIFGPIVFILIVIIGHVIAPLSGSPILFAGFYAFGRNVAFYYAIGALSSSIFNYWIAKRWGRVLVEKFIGKENIHKVDKLTQNYGLLMLFFLRVFQVGIYEYVSYAAGLTAIKFTPYLITSTLGSIPGFIILYFLTSYIDNPVNFILLNILLAYILALIFVVGVLIIKYRKSSKSYIKKINNLFKTTKMIH